VIFCIGAPLGGVVHCPIGPRSTLELIGDEFSAAGASLVTKEERMREIVVSQFVTLDGVMEDPGGSEGFERGGWAFQFERGPEGDQFKLDEVMAAGALLLGRVTYEGFAAAWPSREGEFADKFNTMPKYVVSTTLEDPEWSNSTVIRDVGEVAALKDEEGGEILVNGSAQLVRALMERELVDEYRLMVFPVVLGAGKRLFDDGAPRTPLRVVETKSVGEVVILTLRPAL
jgi:dihydrofolate reductase